MSNGDEKGSAVMMGVRVSPAERRAIEDLARANDRTPSREIRRAVRFYIRRFAVADRYLKGEAQSQNTAADGGGAED